MKKLPIFVVMLVLTVGLALIILHLSTMRTSSFLDADLSATHHDSNKLLTSGRKLKDNGKKINGNKKNKKGSVSLDDYHKVDPAPAKASINHRPIEHGTPVIPYIPKPSPPPACPRYGGST